MAHTNVVLITVDAWRADFVDVFDGVRLTPALDRVADRTVRFDRMYANAPWTTPALVSVFGGEPVDRHGVHHEWSTPRPGGPALAGNLQRQGFSTPNLCYLNALENYANLGFTASKTPPWPPKEPEAASLVSALRARTADARPFFAWYHHKWVHLPYWPAERYLGAVGLARSEVPAQLRDAVCSEIVCPRDRFALSDDDTPLVRALYAAGVLEMNDWLGEVLDAFDELDLWPSTTLVLTSDHGEELLDHGHVGHASTAHHATLYDEVLRVPLLIVDRRVEAPRSIGTRVQGLDLFPTLHALAGVEAPPCAGVDLSGAVFGDALDVDPHRIFRFRSAVQGCPTPRELVHQFVDGASDGRHKVVREDFGSVRAWLHDLQIDPAEQDPITDGPELDAWLEQL